MAIVDLTYATGERRKYQWDILIPIWKWSICNFYTQITYIMGLKYEWKLFCMSYNDKVLDKLFK